MIWPFRKNQTKGEPAISQPDQPRPPNRWPEAADPPEDWADPEEAARYDLLMQERIERNRERREPDRASRSQAAERYRPRGKDGQRSFPPGGSEGEESVNIFPRIGATRRDLVDLGSALAAWRDLHFDGVRAISGLGELLAGHYPEMELYMGCINSYTLYAPGWEVSPAVVTAGWWLMPGEDLIGCLQDELPEDLWSSIDWISRD